MTAIRPATAADAPRLQAIEVAAGQAFRDVGMPEIADDEPPSEDTLTSYQRGGRSWVAVDDADIAVAYVLVDIVDGAAHVEQVSVHPDAARQGVGRALLDHVAAWAAAGHLATVTLTTFRDIPWNAPYYERCGFRVLAPHEIGPELAALQRHEADAGLDPTQRVAMYRAVARP